MFHSVFCSLRERLPNTAISELGVWNFGSKMGVDATHKWPSEDFTHPWPDEIKMDPEVKKKIDGLWPRLGLGIDKV
jgi:3-polyprenyl-4-hydroxybenzoate decarboxylase